VGATASTPINRKDLNINDNRVIEAAGAVVGDGVKINLEIEAIEKKTERSGQARPSLGPQPARESSSPERVARRCGACRSRRPRGWSADVARSRHRHADRRTACSPGWRRAGADGGSSALAHRGKP
jgi:hypothetical protein